MNLDAIVNILNNSPKESADIIKSADFFWKDKPFIPTVGKQCDAYFSEADVLLFGGKPGGGKTALGCGLALNEHHRSLLVRRNFVDLDGVLHTLTNILGNSEGLTRGNRPKFAKANGGVIDFMGIGEDLGGKQGNPHDFIYIDEAAQIPENQFRMLMGWLRTDKKDQRCRIVLGSNPPLDTIGDWLIGYFAPWLDAKHPNPAKEGELRYFLPNEGGKGDRECGVDEESVIYGVKVKPQSRTFISSSFTDNPFYDHESYAKTLAGLPDGARHILMSGDFMSERQDDEFQVIPTAWVKEAQARWMKTPPAGVPMTAMGVDAVRGGGDCMAIAPRYDGWFDEVITIDGEKVPDGDTACAEVVRRRRDNCMVIVDVVGVGSSPVDSLRRNGIKVDAYNGAESSIMRTTDKLLSFYNKRAESWWKFREALDPSQQGGSKIMLPPDTELLSDLCTPRIKNPDRMSAQGILLEAKQEIKKRIGRSPDKGDAVVMAWNSGIVKTIKKEANNYSTGSWMT